MGDLCLSVSSHSGWVWRPRRQKTNKAQPRRLTFHIERDKSLSCLPAPHCVCVSRPAGVGNFHTSCSSAAVFLCPLA